MKLWRKLLFRFRRERFEEELAEEMRLHQELRAERSERRRFGNMTALREASRDVWSWAWLDELGQNARYAWRLTKKSPGFTTVAALTLALGIGANTAVFSILDAVLLRPLPYRDPGRLVVIWDVLSKAKEGGPIFASYGDFEQFEKYARSFSSISAATWASGGRVWKNGPKAVSVLPEPVTIGFFGTLGVRAELGRTFNRSDTQRGCALVLSHDFWMAKMNGNRAVLNRTLALDDTLCDVVGVMPASFSFYPRVTAMWMLAGPNYKNREKLMVGTFARLKPGVTRAQATEEVKELHRRLHAADGQEKNIESAVFGLQDEFTFLAGRTLRTTVWLMAGAVFLVLLIACVNVANLLLGRSLVRERELAVRAAIGSGRARLVRQLLTEALLLAVLGSVGGLALAWGAIRWFNHLAPIELPVGADVAINVPVIVFSSVMTLGTTLLFGLLPAWRAAKLDVNQALKAGGRSAGQQASRQTIARVLVTAEVMLSVVLLVGAGLLTTSLMRLGNTPLGFDPRGLWVTDVTLQGSQYTNDAQRVHFFDEVTRRLPPGPNQAFAIQLPPYLGGNGTVEVVGSKSKPLAGSGDAGSDSVSPFYFATMRTRMLSGRDFDERDRAGSTPVAIVNAALAREYFPGRNPVGQQIRLGSVEHPPILTIVGVVEDQKHTELMHEMSWLGTPMVYRPYLQEPDVHLSVVTRAADSSHVPRQIAAIDRNVPVSEAEKMETRLAVTSAFARFRAALVGAFAVTAILLAAIGLHGVLAQFVSQRTPEFGVRMAIGAQTLDVFLLVAKQGGGPVAAGLLAGLAAALGLKRVIANLLYETQAADPVVMAAIMLLLCVAGLAIVLPARRATQVDPAVALRNE
jgi:putative ABC transport system permease protein